MSKGTDLACATWYAQQSLLRFKFSHEFQDLLAHMSSIDIKAFNQTCLPLVSTKYICFDV